MLTRLATILMQKPGLRRWLFLGAACLSILFIGYHFGTFDQFAHIPFLKAYADPTLYPNDPFLALRDQNYSYFWHIFAQVYRLDMLLGNQVPWVLGSVMLLVHLCATYFFFRMIWEISLELFEQPEIALLSVIGFILPHFAFGGFPILEFSLLNRTFVLPFLLLAILLYLRGRRTWAFLLIGLLFNLHVLTANFVIAMFGLDSLLRLRTLDWRRLILEVSLLLAAAAPTLIWKFSSPAQSTFIDQAWFDLVARGFLLHLFYLIAPYAHVLASALAGFSTLALYAIPRWQQTTSKHQPAIDHFILAICIILVVQLVSSLLLPITLIIQLQIIRAGLFASVFGYLYFIAFLYRRLQAQPAARGQNLLLLSVTMISTFAFIPLVVALLQRWLARLMRPRWQYVSIGVFLVVFALAIIPLVSQMHLWDPSLHPWGRQNAWYDAQVWARQNTPKTALFITPPHKWGIYDSDWRVFSERGTVVEHADLLMVALAPDYTATWLERFERLAPGAAAQFNGNYFENVSFVKNAYYTLTEADFRRAAADYGASYLVLEKPNRRDFPILYENEEFTIYRLNAK